MRRCSKCDTWKDQSNFTINRHNLDGLSTWCKVCTRNNSSSGYFKYRKKRTSQIAKYRKTLAGRKVSQKAVDRWKEKNPKKYITHQIVRLAIKYGVLVAQPCKVCRVSVVHAHHEDYDRPYDVVWLCPQHHKDIEIDRLNKE